MVKQQVMGTARLSCVVPIHDGVRLTYKILFNGHVQKAEYDTADKAHRTLATMLRVQGYQNNRLPPRAMTALR